MAVSLDASLSVSKDCKTLTIDHDHNHDANDVDTAHVDVYFGSELIKEDISLNVSDVQNNETSDITTQDTESTTDPEVFDDGVYKITIKIVYVPQPDTTYKTDVREIAHCKSDSCIASMVANATEENCNCEEKKVEESFMLYMMVQGAIFSFSCGSYQHAHDKIVKVQKSCDADCGCN